MVPSGTLRDVHRQMSQQHAHDNSGRSYFAEDHAVHRDCRWHKVARGGWFCTEDSTATRVVSTCSPEAKEEDD